MIILMLNLLISIIGEAQAKFTETKDQQTYREKALQISQKGRSIFWPCFKSMLESKNGLEALYIVHQASSQQ